MDDTIDMTEVTNQGASVELFEDNDVKTVVAQINGPTGTRKAQMLFAVGFISVPVPGDRLAVTEIGNGLHAIGGNCEQLIESLGVSGGDRVVCATDASGNLISKTVWKNDGTVETSNDSGAVALGSDGIVTCGDGDEPVAMSSTIDSYFQIIDTMLSAVDPLVGNIYTNLKQQAFPPSGELPSVVSENLIADLPPLIPEP